MTTAIRELYGDFVRTFGNVLFAVSLFVVWGVLTLIGVIVDQGKPPEFYADNYAPALARLVLRLHLDNIYHSPGYVAMIGLIVGAMTFATFRKVIPARIPRLAPVKIGAIPLNATISIEGDGARVRDVVETFFTQRGWQVRKRDHGGVEWTFADRHNWARRGVLVAHVGFVVIAVGTTIYWKWGFSGETAIVAGTSTTIPQTGAVLALRQFRYRIDPIRTRSGITYQPIDYVSELTVTGKDGVPRERTLRVNAPIDVDGTLYYQSSYGFAIDVVATKDGRPLPNAPAAPLKEGEGFQLGATTRTVQYARFVGTIDRRTGGIAPDPRPNDPGAVMTIFDGDQALGQVLVPFGQSIDLGSGYRIALPRYTLYSGLQYRYDPGIPLVGIGAFVLLLGLCISFYFVPARLFVRIDSASPTGANASGALADSIVPQWNVGIAATTVKGYEIFEEQFEALVEALRTQLVEHQTPMKEAASPV